MTSEHEKWILRAVELARQTMEKGNRPFGAVLVHEETNILEARNTVVEDRDPTQHAELRLVSQAARRFSRELLQAATVYASTEPCAMCAGAIYWTGIRRIVFGCAAETLASYTDGSFVAPCAQVLASAKESVEIIGPVLEGQARRVFDEARQKEYGKRR